MADEIDISDFVMRKGALSIIFELGKDHMSFNELKASPTVLISPNTLSNRISEAQDLGLVERTIDDERGRATIDYKLTETGEVFLAQFEDVSGDYFQLKKDIAELKEKMHSKEEEIKKLLSDHAGQKLEEQVEGAGKTADEAAVAGAPVEGGEVPEKPAEVDAEGDTGEPGGDETVAEESGTGVAEVEEVEEESEEGVEGETDEESSTPEPSVSGSGEAETEEGPGEEVEAEEGEPEVEEEVTADVGSGEDEDTVEEAGEAADAEELEGEDEDALEDVEDVRDEEPKEEVEKEEETAEEAVEGEETGEMEEEEPEMAPEEGGKGGTGGEGTEDVESAGEEAGGEAEEESSTPEPAGDETVVEADDGAGGADEALEGEEAGQEAGTPDYLEVVEGSVEEVKEAVREHDLDAAALIAAERENRNRESLLEWLEERVEEDAGAVEAEEGEKESGEGEERKAGEGGGVKDMDAKDIQEEIEKLRKELDIG